MGTAGDNTAPEGRPRAGGMGWSPSVAIIGTGFIGEVHARAVRLAGGRLVAVGASTPDRSREAVRRLGAQRTIDSPEELANSNDIDVAHICTPNALHASYADAALRSGKHVVCEKPLSTSADQAAALAELAAEQGLVATVPFVYRFYPMVRHAKQLVLAGGVGDIRLLHGSYLQDWMSDAADWSWRVEPTVNGPSRAFADIGSHWCDLIEFVSGHRIVSLIARLDVVIGARTVSDHATAFSSTSGDGVARAVETEDVARVLFETDRGASGSVVISQISIGRKNRLWFEINGATLSMSFDQETPETLIVADRGTSAAVVRGAKAMTGDAARLSELPPGHPQGYRDCFDAFVRDTYNAIGGEVPDGLPTFHDGVRAACIVDAVLASSKTDSWVEVPR
jgi:predicted dehydrogenase